jgi:copper chaperone CopZ
MKIASYSHVTPGRLRIKIPKVKGSPDTAQQVERDLRNVKGVNSVTANPLTGNALILFDDQYLTHSDLIDVLIMQGYLERQRNNSRRSKQGASLDQLLHPEYIARAVADVVLQTAVEFAVKRALLALV